LPEDGISFSAKFGEWIAIKKMSIDESTKPEEVAAILASITATIDRKSFEFAGINTGAIDAYADGLTKGKRKGFGTLAEIFGALKQGEVRQKLVEAGGEEKYALAEAYFIRKILSNLGQHAWIDLETLQKVFPEIKIQKPRGNFGGKRKQE